MPIDYHVRDCATNTNVMQDHAVITSVQTLADRISWARERRGLTQTALAKMAGVSQGTIGNLESGARRSPRALISIAMVLGVSALWLESGKGPVESPGSKSAADFLDAFDARVVATPELELEPSATAELIQALGNNIAHLDDRSRRMMGVLLNDLAEHPLDAHDIAARAADIVNRHLKTLRASGESAELPPVLQVSRVEVIESWPEPTESIGPDADQSQPENATKTAVKKAQPERK